MNCAAAHALETDDEFPGVAATAAPSRARQIDGSQHTPSVSDAKRFGLRSTPELQNIGLKDSQIRQPRWSCGRCA